MNDKKAITLSIALFILSVSIFAQPSLGREREETPRGEDIFTFAQSLNEEGDYFRAISEYKRYLFLYPAGKRAHEAALGIAESYYKAERWSEAIAACNQFLARYPDSRLYFEVLYLKGKAEKLNKRYDSSLRTFDTIINAQAPAYRDKAIYQKALIMLERADWQKTRDLLSGMPKDSPLNLTSSALLKELDRVDALPRKSPTTAGMLAAVLPGAGHLYTGRPLDALMAFGLNGAFIWGAWEQFHRENYVTGGILTFFELGWYGGNIYSAVSSAHKYNRQKENEFINNLNNSFSISWHRRDDASFFLVTKRF